MIELSKDFSESEWPEKDWANNSSLLSDNKIMWKMNNI